MRLIRNHPALGMALENSIRAFNSNDIILAQAWLYPVIEVFLRKFWGCESGDQKMIALGRWMEEHVDSSLHLAQLAELTGYSNNQFIRVFKREFQMTPMQYFMRLKMEQAKKMMRYSSMSITEIAAAVGFHDISYFSKAFKEYVGNSPRSYRTEILQETR